MKTIGAMWRNGFNELLRWLAQPRRMGTTWKSSLPVLVVLLVSAAACFGATNDLSATLQTGLFEEEANHDLPSAIKAYSAVAEQFDKNRKLAATAIFRLGECYRKQGATNDAVAQYQRVVRDFSDQTTLVTLSRQSLDELGSPAKASIVQGGTSGAALAEQTRLLQQEINLVENKLASEQKQVETGVLPSSELVPTQRDLLELKRQLAALQAGQPTANPTESETDEVRRIRELITNSPDLINAPDKDGFTLLQTAAAKGKLSVVSLLLQSGAAVDGLKAQDLTPLHYAAGNGHKAVVDLLLMKGARVDAQTESGVTPLHLAALKGYEVVARALLEAGAPVNAKLRQDVSRGEALLSYDFSEGQTPLHAAAKGGYAAVAKLLLTRGADVNAEDGKGRTAMSYAAMQHSLPMVQELLEHHADPNAGSRDLPAAYAATTGDLPLLHLLLSKGADPNHGAWIDWNLKNYAQGNYSPMFIAAHQHHADAARELLNFKGDPNGVAGNGLLFQALPDTPTISALIDGGADVNVPNDNGVTLLQTACSWNPSIEDVVKLLIQKGANVNAQDRSGQTALRYAVNGNQNDSRKEIVALLLASGAKPNVPDTTYRNTPLHIAISGGQQETVKMLLDGGADPNFRNSQGDTALHTAVANHKDAILDLLLKHGGDPNARNNSDLTPLDLAKNQGQQGGPPGLAYQWGPGAQPPFPSLPTQPPFLPPMRTLRAPGSPPESPAPTTPTKSAAELLREHGALDDLPRMDRISLRRASDNTPTIIFKKGTNDWNRFTLLELLAVQCDFLTPEVWGGNNRGRTYVDSGPVGLGNGFAQRLAFPDFSSIRIHRPDGSLTNWHLVSVDLSALINSGDCSKDVFLQWGDVVEVPEADHPLNESWKGFSIGVLTNFQKCLTRHVQVIVKGKPQTLTLAPELMGSDFGRRYINQDVAFWIRPALLRSDLVLASSELSTVKVERQDPVSGRKHEWTVDCRPNMSAPDLWLRAGDVIDVPERP